MRRRREQSKSCNINTYIEKNNQSKNRKFQKNKWIKRMQTNGKEIVCGKKIIIAITTIIILDRLLKSECCKANRTENYEKTIIISNICASEMFRYTIYKNVENSWKSAQTTRVCVKMQNMSRTLNGVANEPKNNKKKNTTQSQHLFKLYLKTPFSRQPIDSIESYTVGISFLVLFL